MMQALRARLSARRAVQREVEQNRARLEQFWGRVRPRQDEDEIHRVDKLLYAREFMNTPLPNFSRAAYAQQPTAKHKKFYEGIARLESLHAQLRAAYDADVASSQRAQPPLTYENFIHVAPLTWDQAHRLIERLLLHK